MPYVAVCRDDPGRDTLELRAREKERHFRYIESILDRLLVAGPLPGGDDGSHGGSLFIYAVDEADAARALLENDPYYRAGIYGDVSLSPFQPAAGQWIGGTIW